MTYPAQGYRSGAARHTAGQAFTGQPVPAGPIPANDNVPGSRPPRPVPKPANDNVRLPRRGPLALPKPLSPSKLAKALGVVSKVHPLYRAYRAAKTAYDIWRMLNPLLPEAGLAFPGMTLVNICDPAVKISGALFRGETALTIQCFTAQARSPLSQVPLGAPYTASERLRGTHLWVQQNNLPRYATTEQYHPIVNPVPAGLMPGPARYPWHWPSVAPQLDPLSLPIAHPVPQPLKHPLPYRHRPYPHRRPNPWRSPTERTFKGYDLPQPRLGDRLHPDKVLQPGHRPKLSPAAHKAAPPPKGTKETKLRVTALSGHAVGKFMNAFSETTDFVDAFYDSLPEKLRKRERAKRHGKEPKLADKLALIYQHIDKIEHGELLKNVAKNQAEDAAFGAVNKGIRNKLYGSPYWPFPHGIGSGPVH